MKESAPPTAALVTVGNELLYGETVDTNAAWLSRSLASRGIHVVRKFTVGDEEMDIRDAVQAAMATGELVLVSGGLGPTPDDLTRDAVASLLGRELRFDEELYARLEERFRRRGYEKLPESNRSQAQVPEGARVLENVNGTAPGLAIEAESSLVVLLPGVPRELRGIYEGDLQDVLDHRFGQRAEPIRHRVLHTTGVPESRLTELVADALPEDTGPVSLAFLPDVRGVDLRLTASGVSAAAADEWFARIESALEPVIGRWRFEAESGDVAEAVITSLRESGSMLAVAESCTGGLVAKRITDVAGSSDVFVGGVIAYADEVKVEMLGVPERVLRREGAVSEGVARAMAEGVAERLGASAAIGVTGVAGPGGGTEEKPVGTVWVSAALEGRVEARLLSLPGDRSAVRERAAQAALAELHKLLDSRGTGT